MPHVPEGVLKKQKTADKLRESDETARAALKAVCIFDFYSML